VVSSCEYYLRVKHDCERYVECVLRNKGFRIVAVDQHGYDVEAYYPTGMYYYFIEVKCGPKAKLSSTQRDFRDVVEIAREEGIDLPIGRGIRLIPKYVVCQFDEYYRLIGDADCRRLLSR
jgi:Holliday junction resolvase